MPSCPKCGRYSPPTVTNCPQCSTRLLFPVEELVASLHGEFPNRLSKFGIERVFSHEGLLYNGIISPSRVKKGQVAWLRLILQSCYVGPVSFVIWASSHSALKNKPIGDVGGQLGPLEVAEVAIPIESTFETKSGSKQVDFNLRCKPFDGVKRITDLDESKLSPDFANVVRSAKQGLGNWWKAGHNVRSDSGALWMKIHYEVLNEQAPEEEKGKQSVLRTIWPVAKF